MDPKDYKKKVEDSAQWAAVRKRAEASDVYDPGKMKVGMPWGCWIWIVIAVMAAAALYNWMVSR